MSRGEESWARVARALDEMRRQFEGAVTEEQCQTVGLLGREVLISLGQAVCDAHVHDRPDEKAISPADAQGMLEAYFDDALPGESNEQLRRFAKAALSLAVGLQHRRTARRRDAQLCEAAIVGVVRVVEILSD